MPQTVRLLVHGQFSDSKKVCLLFPYPISKQATPIDDVESRFEKLFEKKEPFVFMIVELLELQKDNATTEISRNTLQDVPTIKLDHG